MAPRFAFEALTGRYAEAMAALAAPVAKAATAAVTEAGDIVKREARAAMASAGFSGGFQNAFRAQVYPKGGTPSINAAVHFFHKVSYFNVFEEGAAIAGKPLLWLPLKGVPLGRGRKPLTPKQYVDRIGPLSSVRGAGNRPPLLVGKVTRARVLRVTETSARLRKPRKGGRNALTQVNVPLYVGVPAVNIGKKFDVTSIIRRVQGQIGALYLKNLKA